MAEGLVVSVDALCARFQVLAAKVVGTGDARAISAFSEAIRGFGEDLQPYEETQAEECVPSSRLGYYLVPEVEGEILGPFESAEIAERWASVNTPEKAYRIGARPYSGKLVYPDPSSDESAGRRKL